MLAYAGWLIAAFLAGVLFMIQKRIKLLTLKERCASINFYIGREYADLLRFLGEKPVKTLHRKNGTVLRTWTDQNYSLTLSFTDSGICLGVEDELY